MLYGRFKSTQCVGTREVKQVGSWKSRYKWNLKWSETLRRSEPVESWPPRHVAVSQALGLLLDSLLCWRCFWALGWTLLSRVLPENTTAVSIWLLVSENKAEDESVDSSRKKNPPKKLRFKQRASWTNLWGGVLDISIWTGLECAEKDKMSHQAF